MLLIFHIVFVALIVLVNLFMYILIGIKYKGLPEEICSHYNFSGDCDSHSGKGIIFIIPIVSTGISILFSLTYLIPTRYWKVNTGVESIELPESIKREIKGFVCLFCVMDALFISIFMAYLVACMIYGWHVSTIFTVIFMVSLILNSFWLLYAVFSKINQYRTSN